MTPMELREKLASLSITAGEGFFFVVKHQPTRRTTPIRVELRKPMPGIKAPRESLSSLLGFEDTVADEERIYEAALKVVSRAGRVDQLTGVYE